MANIFPTPIRTTRLSALRCAVTGAVVLAVLFAICWAAAAAGYAGGSHRYISLFTLAPEASLTALGVGLCWSVVFGAVSGLLVAVAYNTFAFVERR
jgi:hypothetical protein